MLTRLATIPACLPRIAATMFFFSSSRRHTIFDCDWSSDVCSSDLIFATIKGVLAMVAKMQLELSGPMFNFGASQDPKNSEVVVPQIYQGGLGLPDRDYYIKDDKRSEERRVGKE